MDFDPYADADGLVIRLDRTAHQWGLDAHRSAYCPAIRDWPQRVWITSADGRTACYVIECGEGRR